MAEQHDGARRGRIAELADRVAGVVDEGAIEAGGTHLLDEPRRRRGLVARQRGNRHQPADQLDGGRAIHHGLQLLDRARDGLHAELDLASRVITSGGSSRSTVGPAGSAITP